MKLARAGRTTAGRVPALRRAVRTPRPALASLPVQGMDRPQTQARLRVGPANDRFEQEAERVAERVMAMTADRAAAAGSDGISGQSPVDTETVQRLCTECATEEDEVQRAPEPVLQRTCTDCTADEEVQRATQPTLQRVCDECTGEAEPPAGAMIGPQDEETVQTRRGPATATSPVTPALEAEIDRLRGAGQPLPATLRAFMEPRFGRDFSSVRVHADATADRLSRALGARAFTLGADIFFARGQFDPAGAEGRKLMAHELTHTVQQGAGGFASRRSPPSRPDSAAPLPGPAPPSSAPVAATEDDPHPDPSRREPDPAAAALATAGAAADSSGPGTVMTALTPPPLELRRAPADCPVDQSELPDISQFLADARLGEVRESLFLKKREAIGRGASGDAVALIQDLLWALDCEGIDLVGLLDERAESRYGRATEAAVRIFQRNFSDASGQPLKDDGDIGPLTLGAMDQVLGLVPVKPDAGTASECCTDDCPCPAESAQGAGIVRTFVAPDGSTRWELRNFDIEKFFLKPDHCKGLKETIAPALIDSLAQAGPQGAVFVKVTGEASTTGGHRLNMGLSENRARCIAAALARFGVPVSQLRVFAVSGVGKTLAESRVAARRAAGLPVSPQHIENAADRMVRVELATEQPGGCPEEPRMRESQAFRAWIGCQSPEHYSVVIGDLETPVTYREFEWETVSALSTLAGCRFFPQFDPDQPLAVDVDLPLRLTRGAPDDASAESDFSGSVVQVSQFAGPRFPLTGLPIGPRLFHHVLQRFPPAFAVALPSGEGPDPCVPPPGATTLTPGVMRPVGPVRCDKPEPARQACPTREPEACPPERRDSSASAFAARFDRIRAPSEFDIPGVDLPEIDVPFVDVRSTAALIKLGTAKTADEKPSGGDDIYRRFLFMGRPQVELKGCDQRGLPTAARGKTTTDRGRALNELDTRRATLKLAANSNVASLQINDFGVVALTGDECLPGEAMEIPGVLTPLGEVVCEPPGIPDPEPAETGCKDDCPEARLTCPSTVFRLRVGRMALDQLPPLGRRLRRGLGCQVEAARVNIETNTAPLTKPIWRPFLWLQSAAACPFTVQSTTVLGAGRRLQAGVKVRLRLGWPPIGVNAFAGTAGLRLATSDPGDRAASSDFAQDMVLGSGMWRFAANAGVGGSAGDLQVQAESAVMTALQPVSWHGGCESSGDGVLVPVDRVQCGTAPPATHDLPGADRCTASIPSPAGEIARFKPAADQFLGARPGLVLPEFKALGMGEILAPARFVGKVVDDAGALVDIVAFADTRVTAIDPAGGFKEVLLLSHICAFDATGRSVILRFDPHSCDNVFGKGSLIRLRAFRV